MPRALGATNQAVTAALDRPRSTTFAEQLRSELADPCEIVSGDALESVPAAGAYTFRA